MLQNKPILWQWCKFSIGNGKKLADHLGVTATFISRVINGEKLLPIELIKKTSDFTGISPKDLRPDVWEIMNHNTELKNESDS